MSKYCQEDINSLIDLIIWYRDEWHYAKEPHNEYIDILTNFPSDTNFDMIESDVDSWIDGPPDCENYDEAK